MATMHDFKC
jgi:hypothetical protein